MVHWHGARRSRWNGGGKHGVFTHTKSDEGYGHGGLQNEAPTKKPIRLMRELGSLLTNAGDVVLGPFMGSGSIAVACAQMGRHFIDIETSREYFDVACERIRDSCRQPNMLMVAGLG